MEKKTYKDSLPKYLCMALPYGVICKSPTGCKFTLHQMNPNELTPFGKGVVFDFGKTYYIGDIKPYLRPMSSMTEEEIIEFNNIPSTKNYTIIENDLPWDVAHYKQIDWLLANHFDFMGLIPMDSAIEVTKDNNPYKD